MLSLTISELIGYLASMAVAVSIIMSRNIRLKWINLFAALIVAVYGLVTASWYVGVSNLLFAGITVVIIVQIHRKKEYLRLFEVKPDSSYLGAFIEYYYKEINKTVPYFSYALNENTLSYVLLRNMAAVGVFLAEKKDAKTLLIQLDFVIPEFRNYRFGKHIYFQNQKYFYDLGYRELHIVSLSRKYDEYLGKMGFCEDNSTGERIFVKSINPES